MSRGSWRTIVAIGLSLAAFGILAIAALGIYEGWQLQRTYQVEASEKANEYRYRSKIEWSQRCLPLAPEAEPGCARQIEDSNRENERKERDLEAQRTTAIWTSFMGMAALTGMALSIIGVGLIFVTFRANRRAANSTAAQVRIMQAAQRPDLVLRGADYNVPHAEDRREPRAGAPQENGILHAYFRNHGSGTAYPQGAVYGCTVAKQPPEKPEYPFDFGIRIGELVGGHTDVSGWRGPIVITPEDIACVATREAEFWVWLKADFTDGEGGLYEIAELLRWSRGEAPNRLGLFPVPWESVRSHKAYTYRKYTPPKEEQRA